MVWRDMGESKNMSVHPLFILTLVEQSRFNSQNKEMWLLIFVSLLL